MWCSFSFWSKCSDVFSLHMFRIHFQGNWTSILGAFEKLGIRFNIFRRWDQDQALLPKQTSYLIFCFVFLTQTISFIGECIIAHIRLWRRIDVNKKVRNMDLNDSRAWRIKNVKKAIGEHQNQMPKWFRLAVALSSFFRVAALYNRHHHHHHHHHMNLMRIITSCHMTHGQTCWAFPKILTCCNA